MNCCCCRQKTLTEVVPVGAEEEERQEEDIRNMSGETVWHLMNSATRFALWDPDQARQEPLTNFYSSLQHWKLLEQSNGHYKINSCGSGKYLTQFGDDLDVDWTYPDGQAGHEEHQQLWKLVKSAGAHPQDARYYIQNVQSNGVATGLETVNTEDNDRSRLLYVKPIDPEAARQLWYIQVAPN